MATLGTASQDEIRRVLELFPAVVLRDAFNQNGEKSTVAGAVAQAGDHDAIATFIARYFGRCKQHVYVMADSALGAPLQIAFPEADLMTQDQDHREVYLARVSYTVYARDPFEAIPVTFLWPIRIEHCDGYKVLSVIVLERDPRPFANRAVITTVRHVDEKTIIRAITDLGFFAVDLNRGVKALWAGDYMDAFRVRFKKPFSTTTEVMDEERGIKQDNPQLYDEVVRMPLFDTLFRVHPSRVTGVDSFHVNPTTGRIAFTAYADDAGDTDELVRRILTAN